MSTFEGHRWAAVLALASLYAAIEIPLRLATQAPLGGWVAAADLLVSAVIAVELSRERGAARSDLVVNALALAPGLLVPLAAWDATAQLAQALAPLALLRLLMIYRLWRYAEGLSALGQIHPGVLRLARFGFWLALLIHWIACGWLALRAAEEFVKPVPRYLESVYWAITTLATIGYGDIVPTSAPQIAFAILVMLIGVGVFSYAIGSVAGLLTSLDAAKLAYREKLARIHAFAGYNALPEDLRARIFEYYRRLWDSHLGFDDAQVMQELPGGLRVDVALYLHRDILKRVPFLRDANEALLRDLALALHPAVRTPGEVLFWRGDEGSAMYFVSDGSVDILGAEGELLQRLSAGDFFGEVALLGGATRNATARTASHVRLFKLERRDFEAVLKRHPAFAVEIRRLAAERGLAVN